MTGWESMGCCASGPSQARWTLGAVAPTVCKVCNSKLCQGYADAVPLLGGSVRLLMTLIDLIIISDVTVASMMWNFYRFREGGTCPLAGQPRIFWSWRSDCKIIKLKELSSLLFYMYVYIYFACIYVCAPCVPAAQGGQRELSPCLCKSSECFNLRVISIPLKEVLISDFFQI